MTSSSSLWDFSVTFASFTTFATIYCLHRRLQPEKKPEWSVRLVTMLHAGVVTTSSYFSNFIFGPWPFQEPGLESNGLHLAIISISLGYFLVDYLWCLKYGAEGLIMHVHHLFSLIYLCWGLASAVSGAEIVGAIFGSEITNPMLQMRWMLKQSGNHDSAIGRINDILFATTFLCVRCLVGAYFLYCVLLHPRPSMVVKVGGVIFYIISCLFGIRVIAFAKRKLTVWRQSGFIPASIQGSQQLDKQSQKHK